MIFAELLPANIRTEFTNKVQQIADRQGIKADWLMIVMAFETGKKFNTGSHGNGAFGLIGFRSQTAVELGTSVTALAKMPPVQQLDYVEKYLIRWNVKSKVNTFTDLYITIFTPAYVTKSDSFKIGDASGSATQKAIYAANSAAFDKAKKGYFTKGDIGRTVANWANYSITGISFLTVTVLLIGFLIFRNYEKF